MLTASLIQLMPVECSLEEVCIFVHQARVVSLHNRCNLLSVNVQEKKVKQSLCSDKLISNSCGVASKQVNKYLKVGG